MHRLIAIISLLAGGGDFAAGLLMLAAPQTALRLMHVPPVSDSVWVGFVGVFVACVGLSYLLGLIAWKTIGGSCELRAVWEITAIFRLAAGSFVAVQIGLGHFDHAWITVPCADFFWACLQLAILGRGFPNRE